jgi:hypothetical protein
MPVSVAAAVVARLPSGSQWESRQVVVTPEMLGLRSTVECQQRAEKLGLTPLPPPPYRQQYWRLDVLLEWSRANGFDRLPALGRGPANRPIDRPFRIRAQ